MQSLRPVENAAEIVATLEALLGCQRTPFSETPSQPEFRTWGDLGDGGFAESVVATTGLRPSCASDRLGRLLPRSAWAKLWRA